MTGALALSKSNSGSLGVGIGGFGGTGGTADDVTGSLSGDVTTSGTESFGVLAQSQGGGGGNGAINVSGALTFGMDTSVAAAIGVGGFGGDGGASGDVSFTRTGITTTSSEKSDGVTIQSVGGGGGNGGINVSGGIAGTTKGTSATLQRRHRRLRRQGELGRQALSASSTGDVSATGTSFEGFRTIDGIERYVTEGGSNGIIAQSQGGGGGNGGINVSGGISLGAPSGSSYGLTVGIGGFGGAGGDADTVDLTVAADDVTARGDDKTAVLAQSVGGGGGNGAINVSGGITMDGALTVGIGGSGGGGGKAGDVTASVASDLWATGSNARGFAAQSIGGGGGNGGINISGGIMADKTSSNPSLVFGLGGAGGAAQTGGAVTATQTGAMQVDRHQLDRRAGPVGLQWRRLGRTERLGEPQCRQRLQRRDRHRRQRWRRRGFRCGQPHQRRADPAGRPAGREHQFRDIRGGPGRDQVPRAGQRHSGAVDRRRRRRRRHERLGRREPVRQPAGRRRRRLRRRRRQFRRRDGEPRPDRGDPAADPG